MPNTKQALIANASQSWQEAGRRLGIRIVAPFTLRVEDQSANCLAFLPDFGGPNGMVIGATLPPAFDTDPCLIRLAERKNIYYSFVNPVGWSSLDEEAAKDALIDWGFFGPPSERPMWLAK